MSDAVAADSLSSVPVAVRWLAAIVFVVAMPLFLILGNILDVASDRAFYASEFQKYRIREVTRIDDAQLTQIADRFIQYLREPSATLDIDVTIDGARRKLFNAKEVSHMVDVQKLFQLAGQARLVAGAILLLIPLLGIGLGGGPAFLPRLGLLLVAGGVATVALLGLAGLLSLVDFTEAWTQFHHVAFSNDDWMLDPRTDYLIMLYPEGFWFDAVMKIATQSALEAVVLGGIGVGIMFFGARR